MQFNSSQCHLAQSTKVRNMSRLVGSRDELAASEESKTPLALMFMSCRH